MTIEQKLKQQTQQAIEALYGIKIAPESIQIQKTRKEFVGSFTLVVFPFLKISKKKPEDTATDLGNFLKGVMDEVAGFNVAKGFLNIELSDAFWLNKLQEIFITPNYGVIPQQENAEKIVIEYSSPNTNKPLHLGHVRNNLLGYSLAEIYKLQGYNVKKVNLVNDRGIHICKSMLAWQNWGEGQTPETTQKKGDHLVGEYYVKFNQEYNKEVEQLIAQGKSEEQAKKEAPLMLDAQKMLKKWERENKKVRELWKTMNNWVYAGFDETYKKLGVDFDKIYYESETYLTGKKLVLTGLKEGILSIRDDESVYIDLTNEGLDTKILLRSDGTSVYMTQDIGTALIRYEDFNFDKSIYVVGNEQDYHFKVLAIILQKLGFKWAENIQHLSYGMVELPEGKMKSREGTVVDADDLIDEMINTARETSEELGKLEGYSPDEAQETYRKIAMGALKYFILRVDPKKNMVFNPKESIDFNGNTGPFIQYTYTRIRSVMRKAAELNLKAKVPTNLHLSPKEVALIHEIKVFPDVLAEAAANQSPAHIAAYMYDLAKEYNQFYHDHPILKEENTDVAATRLAVSQKVAAILKTAGLALGIEMPERM